MLSIIEFYMNMKNIKYIILLAGLFVWAACSNSEYEFDNLFPEEFHKTLYIKNEGMHDILLYNTEADSVYRFSVYKAGSDPSLKANATVGIISEEVIQAEYAQLEGVNYKILPQTAYTLNEKSLDFESKESYKFVSVNLHPGKVKEALDSDATGIWILPFEITSKDTPVNTSKNRLILKITAVVTPTIGFKNSGVHSFEYTEGSTSQIRLSIPFALTVDNSWAIDTEFEIDESYVAQYNQANNTNYALLPAGYTLPLQLALTTREMSLELQVPTTGLEPEKGYMLPIRIKDISMFEIAQNASMYIPIIKITYPLLDRTGWTAETNTEEREKEGTYRGYAQNVLDGNNDSFWHSQWYGDGANPPLPHELIIDTKATYEFTQMGIIDRLSQKYIKTAEIYVSTDKNSWQKVGDIQLDKSNNLQKFRMEKRTGRYVKIKVLETHDGRALSALAEVYLYGYKK